MIEIERLRQLKENRLTRQSTDESQSPVTTAAAGVGETATVLSEKAKGKLPEGSLSRVSSTSSVGAAGGNGPHRQASVSSISSTASLPGAKNGFIPTDDWVRNHTLSTGKK